MKRLTGSAALVVVCVTAAGCSAAPSSRVSGTPGPVHDTVGGPVAAGPVASASPSATSEGRSLVLPQTVRAEIVRAWTAAEGLEPGQVAGLRPGAYYGYMPATHTFWALVEIAPSTPTPSSKVAARIQDGPWVLSRRQGQGWRLVGGTGGVACPTSVPGVMLDAWALPRVC